MSDEPTTDPPPAATLDAPARPELQPVPQPEIQSGTQSAKRPGRRRHLWCLAVVLGLIALDLWSKGVVMPWLESWDPRMNPGRDLSESPLTRDGGGRLRYLIAGEWLAFMHNLNYGAAFGKLEGIPYLLVVGRCLAALLLAVLIYRAPLGSRVYLAALVLILAGALGNLWDNFFVSPHPDAPGMQSDKPFKPVRDFIDVYFTGWDWHFPTFNFADSCISVGAVLLILSGLGPKRVPVPSPDEVPDEEKSAV